MNIFKRLRTNNQLVICALLSCTFNLTNAAEHHIAGLLDVRLSLTDSFESYLEGGYGKFGQNDGSNLSLSQLALTYHVDWENNLSMHLVTNAYIDDINNGIGITEAYLKYRTVPNDAGYRYQFRAGFMYPKISLENIVTGWASPYSLNYSTMNTWLGEEVRHLGLEANMTKLGKFSNDPYDLSLGLSLFNSNDPNGSMLTWHGWTQSSRQTFWNQKLAFPQIPALSPGQALQTQAHRSDPFIELDSKVGYHINGEWNLRGSVKVSLGYYDNRGDIDIVEDGQYGWITNFSHAGIKWNIAKDLTLITQYMSGDTRMRVVNNFDVVAADFNNVYLLLSKTWGDYRLSGRIESFNVKDLDDVSGDNNNEDGSALTLSFIYKISKQLRFHSEYNWISSNRFSRNYLNLDINADEKQLQFALRYFF